MSKTVDPETTEYNGRDAADYWREQLDHSEKVFKTWQDRGEKVARRYRDERQGISAATRFNIFWSNVELLKPSLYGRPAKPEVSRRNKDADPVGRVAAEMLERTLLYEVEKFPDFHDAMLSSVEDRLIPGRGIAWARYDPVFAPMLPEVTDSEGLPTETITSVHTPIDYIYWKDFRHSPARTWNEVWWVARRVFMTRTELVDRFGAAGEPVPLKEYDENDADKSAKTSEKANFEKKAQVWEIWNKRTGKVCWLAKDYPEILDEKDDFLHLDGFFPCPKPLYATMTNGTLIPVPDYCEYQDQAEELDSITGRLSALVEAVRVAGVYNSEYKELGRLLSSTGNNLVPVQGWAAFAEKQGLKGAFELLDNSTTIQAITVLTNQREAVKQTIYEICGISDILRGASKAEETLGAQELKAQFGSLRLRESQADVARFASDIFKLKAQIICQFYPPELILQMSGIEKTVDGQNPELVMAALQLLGNSTVRDFQIAVESDSLAQIDEDAEKQAANEAITAITGFVKEAMPMAQAMPATLPMLKEMLLFITRKYRAGRSLEASIEQSMKALEAAAAQPKGPSPEQIEAQMQQQADQARIAADTQAAQMKEQFAAQREKEKLAAESQLEQIKMQLEMAVTKYEGQLAAVESDKKNELERYRIDKEAAVKLQIAQMDIDCKREAAQMTAETSMKSAELQASTAKETATISAQSSERMAVQKSADTAVQAKSAENQAATTASTASPAPTINIAVGGAPIEGMETGETAGPEGADPVMSLYGLGAKSKSEVSEESEGKGEPKASGPVEVSVTVPRVIKQAIKRDNKGRPSAITETYDDGKTIHKVVRLDADGHMIEISEVEAS